MRRATKHALYDRIALSALWFVFPARLVAESLTAAIYGGGGFLTGSLGSWLGGVVPTEMLTLIYEPSWWFYSSVLGLFFVALPFSRYMHIFTEIPLIFLRRWQLRPSLERKSYDNFEVEVHTLYSLLFNLLYTSNNTAVIFLNLFGEKNLNYFLYTDFKEDSNLIFILIGIVYRLSK